MHRFIAAVILSACTASAALGGVSRIDTLIPTPQEVVATETSVCLDGAVLVQASADPRLDIAVAELNGRMRELGAEPLAVRVDAGDIPWRAVVLLHADTASGRQLIAQHGLRLSDTDPGPQGYVIHWEGGAATWRVFLAGSDVQGLLYAAVTFRQLMRPVEPADGMGRVAAEVVSVRDWPDFKERQIGVPFAVNLRGAWYDLRYQKAETFEQQQAASDAFYSAMTPYIDWLFRHKSSMMDPVPWSWAAPPESTPAWQKAAIRRVLDHARERGIRTFYYEDISIGDYPKDQDNPDFKGILLNQGHRRYYCWSRLDYHRRKARGIAEMMRDCGYRAFYVHDVDSGGWNDPALWSRRCEHCRQTYGDDHVKANLAVFGIYHEEITRLVPDVVFVAVIYPYSPNYLSADWIAEQMRGESGDMPGLAQQAAAVAGKHRRFLERMGEGLPPDIHICVRENTRENIDLIRAAYGTRPFHFYFEFSYWKGWRPRFSMTPRWCKTFLYPEVKDILYANMSLYGYNPLTQLAAAEYAWNSAAPGAASFPGRAAWTQPDAAVTPDDVARQFAERACRDVWGDVAGPSFVPFALGNLSVYFVHDPDEVARKMGPLDMAQSMTTQAHAAMDAEAALAGLWARLGGVQQAQAQGMPAMAVPYFVDYWKLALGLRIAANCKAAKLQARDAIVAGDMTAADTVLATLDQQLDTDEQELTSQRRALEGTPSFARMFRKKDPFGALFELDVDELRNGVAAFNEERESLFASFNIPQWFAESAKSRRFVAVRTETPPLIDGRMDDTAWEQTLPIEHFVNHQRLQFASRETVAYALFDDDHLYVGFRCEDSKVAELSIPRRARDEHQDLDSVELFLDPGRTRKTFCQWIVDAGGNVFDAARRQQAGGKLAYEVSFDSRASSAVSRGEDGWTAEFAVPFAELGGVPKEGAIWGFNVCRNIVHTRADGKTESVSAGFLDGASFHSVERFPTLGFHSRRPEQAPLDVRLDIRRPSFRVVTTGDGQASECIFDAILESSDTLHEVELRAMAFDGDRKVAHNVWRRRCVELKWRSPKPLGMGAREPLDGIEMQFLVKAREGAWQFRHAFGSPRRTAAAPAEFVAGVDAVGQALASPCVLPGAVAVKADRVPLLDPAQGTIDFWIRPDWGDARESSPIYWYRNVILHAGPVRHEHPYLTNNRCFAIARTGSGALVFQITNRSYKSRAVSAPLTGWRPGEWHHVACQWRLAEGVCEMAIFLDGKTAGAQSTAADKEPFVREAEALPVQIGAMNTGVLPARAVIDELRFSHARRWTEDFTPRRHWGLDRQTRALYRFDGGLTGEGADDTQVPASAGTAG